MKRILSLTTAALMGASTIVAPAVAQTNDTLSSEPGINTELDAGAETGTDLGGSSSMDLDTGTTAAIGGSADGALSAIDGSSSAAAALGTMTQVDSINVVRVSEFADADASAVEQAATANQTGVDELRAAIQANAALSQQLQAEGVDTASVIGAEVGADGELTVYVM